MGERRLLFLHHPQTGRRLQLEVPTVFGRSDTLHVYAGGARFSSEDALRLAKLDWVEVSGDIKVSRTHGVLDPAGPWVRDLNSTNGIYVNGRLVPGTPGREGPPHPLRGGDVIQVGDLRLVVELDQADEDSFAEWLALDRQAFLAPDDSLEAAALEAFLHERKRFRTASFAAWAPLEAALQQLRASPTGRLGIVVVALVARPEGPCLHLGGQRVDVADVVSALAALPGTKLLALQAEGDPSACERAFRDLAFQDMVLVTSTVPSHSGVLEPLHDDGASTSPLQRVARAVSAEAALGPYHAVLDGLDGLIRPDSNVLDQSWLDGYQGALQVIVGSRLHAEPGLDLQVSYLCRPDADQGTTGSFRVRHAFDSSRFGDPHTASALTPSWRNDLVGRAAPRPGRGRRLEFRGEQLLEYVTWLAASKWAGILDVTGARLRGHLAVRGGRLIAALDDRQRRNREAALALLALSAGELVPRASLPVGLQPEVDLDLVQLLAEARARRAGGAASAPSP